jgi:hypothetical protein
MQAMLVEADPERFFVPPYVGHRGWLGFRLDRELDRDELAGLLEDAYVEVAPPKLVAQLTPSTDEAAAPTDERSVGSGRSPRRTEA